MAVVYFAMLVWARYLSVLYVKTGRKKNRVQNNKAHCIPSLSGLAMSLKPKKNNGRSF